MNKFKVSFTEIKKYNPATRTIGIETMGNALDAIFLIHQQFGKKRIRILSVISEDGTDFLKPIPTVENTIEDNTIDISEDIGYVSDEEEKDIVESLSKLTPEDLEIVETNEFLNMTDVGSEIIE